MDNSSIGDISNSALFTPIQLGAHNLKNRIVMAPLTRCRADKSTGVPNEMHIKYYSERSEYAAFVRTECSPVSKRGNSFPGACGIYTLEQVEGWKKVTQAVHDKNGIIFLQIWHCGRAAISEIIGDIPLSSSSIKNRHKMRTDKGYVDYEEPSEMTEEDIDEVLEEFRIGAENALMAGFDGIELHGANGYLIDQFLRDSVNIRKDCYGETIENRCIFPLKVIDVLISVFGSGKVGIKITPVGRLNDMFDSNPVDLYSYLLKELDKRKVAYVEIVKAPEFRPVDNFYGIKGEEQIEDVYKTFRSYFSGVIIANNGFNFDSANDIIKEGNADMVSFGRLFISNPDLPERLLHNYPLAEPNPSTFYTPGPEGYIDYPKYS